MIEERIGLIRFDRAHRCLIVSLLFLFGLCVLAGLHGFSLPEWRTQLDGSEAAEVLLGRPRDIRADDWFAALPTILAQRQHAPPFPIVNGNIGLGTDMVVNSIKTPVTHYVTLFRPHLWGYFVGNDAGLAWHWWSLGLGLFYSYFLCFQLISRGRFLISISGALLIACSPFFQFKSLEYGEIAIFAALVFVSLVQLFFAASRGKRVLNALLLAWSAAGLALNFYPPSQISLAYLLVFLSSGFLFQHRRELLSQGEWQHRLLCFGGAAALALLPVATFVAQGWETLQLISHTVFPGSRFVTGGDYPFWRLFSNNFLLQFSLKDWTFFFNICEYASFLMFFPGLAVWVAYQAWRGDRQIDWFVLTTLLFCFALTAFAVVGLGPWWSAITLMSKVPPNRSVVALGVANVFLLVAIVSAPQARKISDIPVLITAVAWLAFLFLVAARMRENLSDLTLVQVAGPAVLLSVLLYALLQERFKKAAMFALALVSVGASCWFNPFVRGGSAYLYTNPLAEKMRTLSAHDPGARWVTFSPIMFFANYPRLLGIPALNGTHPYPQFDLWSRFDPERRLVDQYNRYGHVWFTAAPSDVVIESPFLDQIKVSLPPHSPILADLNVKYFLVIAPEDLFFDQLENFSKVFSHGRAHIYVRD